MINGRQFILLVQFLCYVLCRSAGDLHLFWFIRQIESASWRELGRTLPASTASNYHDFYRGDTNHRCYCCCRYRLMPPRRWLSTPSLVVSLHLASVVSRQLRQRRGRARTILSSPSASGESIITSICRSSVPHRAPISDPHLTCRHVPFLSIPSVTHVLRRDADRWKALQHIRPTVHSFTVSARPVTVFRSRRCHHHRNAHSALSAEAFFVAGHPRHDRRSL